MSQNPASPQPAPLLVTVPEACRLLATSKSGFYRGVKAGRYRLVKLGPNTSRVILSDILALVDELADHRQPPE